MKKQQTLHIVGNWKMNPNTVDEAKVLLKDILSFSKKVGDNKLSLAVPNLFVTELVKQSKGLIDIGVQNVHPDKNGAHTGDVSVSQVLSSGACFTVIGHSERRALGETDEIIGQKVTASVTQGLSVVLCVGETVRDDSGEYLRIIKNQVTSALSGIDKKFVKRITIAYEPVWAIGSKATGVATPVECLEVIILVRRTLSDLYGDAIAKKVVILYGGSANSENALGFVEDGGAQGFLLGRASLDAEELKKICTVNK